MTNEDAVDYVLMGLGNPQLEFLVTRRNAGYIFSDYLANCISMQNTLLAQQYSEKELSTNVIPEGFKRPVFVRKSDLYSLVYDCTFSLTEADLHTGPPSTLRPGADTTLKKSLRVVIVKPMTDISESGLVLKKVIQHYKIKDVAKQVIVAYYDCNTLPGTISIQRIGGVNLDGSDVRGTEGNLGIKNIIQELGNNFVRFRLGVGRSNSQPDESYVLDPIPEANQEIDLFGYALDITGQAFQHYIAFGDIKATKKKFGTSRKLPKTLRKLPGLLFPIDVEEEGSAEKATGPSPQSEA